MKTKLRRYQIKGVQFIQNNGGRAYLGDDPGLGKTLQVITWRKWFLPAGRTVIVVPAYLKYNWEEEFTKHDPKAFVQLLHGQKVPPGFGLDAPKRAVYVVNYQILKFWVPALRRLKPAFVAADESQALGNPDSQQTRAFRRLQEGVPHLVFMSGTPAVNRPIELWPALNMLDQEAWGTYKAFGHRYCGPEWTAWGWKYNGASNEDKLRRKLRRNGFVRRTKEQVMKDLPPKSRVLIPVELSSPGEYKAAEAGVARWLKMVGKGAKGRAVDRRAKIGELRMLVGKLKMKAVISWVTAFNQSGRKLLAFCAHTEVVKGYHEAFKDCSELVYGGTNKERRQAAFKRVVNDPGCLDLFANIRAAGTGWSAPGISDVCFPEFDWTPGAHDQAEDRTRGIGRGVAGVPTTAYYLYARDTVDEMMLKIQEKKRRSLTAIFDGKGSTTDSEEDLDLLEQMILDRHHGPGRKR